MTGQRRQPEELRQKLSQLIRYEMQSMPTASLGKIKSLDESSRRATIETVPDGNTIQNVPIAEEFVSSGAGDLTPLNPETREAPVRGLVIYLHHPLDQQLSAGGEIYNHERDHEEEDAVFLPAMIWFDDDKVPEHDPDDRDVRHHGGAGAHFDEKQATLDHPEGASISVIAEPEDELAEGPMSDLEYDPAAEVGEAFVEADTSNREWPLAPGDAAARMSPDGEGEFTVTKRGAALEGLLQNLAVGALNQGERKPLAGPHQHMHLVDHGDNEFSLAGPQLEFREFIAWMTDTEKLSRLRNSDQYRGAQVYAERYLAWLEGEMGRSIDPTDPTDWPDPEPMPTRAEQHAFRGDAVVTPPAAGSVSSPLRAGVSTTYGDFEWEG